MDAVLLVDVGDGADELGEALLDLVDGELPVSEEVVVEFLAWGMMSAPKGTRRCLCWGMSVLLT